MNEREIEMLRDILINSNPMLFLGAGFSIGATCNEADVVAASKLKNNILNDLMKNKITDEELSEVKEYTLEDICQQVYSVYNGKKELKEYLIKTFKGTRPGKDEIHKKLLSYDWKRIYTINIDDLVENIYKESRKDIVIQNAPKLFEVEDYTELIKLHGCVNNPNDGFVFSRQEYDDLISEKLNLKMNMLINDIQKENFIFIGTSFDERDIDYYLNIYKKAGAEFKKGKLIFINPKPSFKLKNRIEDLKGHLIECDVATFLNFLDELKFNPNKLQRSKRYLEYSGIYCIEDIRKVVDLAEVYESRLYEGYFCDWKDIFYEWDFLSPFRERVIDELENMIKNNLNIQCLSLYGDAFGGKSCIIKQLGAYLYAKSYDVLEYRGRYLSKKALQEYIIASPKKKFALLIDNGSYYYRIIEQFFNMTIGNNELIIITTSRTYYHIKKKYYLDGNNYVELKLDTKISRNYAETIAAKLKEKGYLGYLSLLDSKKQINEIVNQQELINLLTDITLGQGFKQKLRKEIKKISQMDSWEYKLLLELVIFDKADIPYYPSEMFTVKYGFEYNKIMNRNDACQVIDYLKFNNLGISLKNNLLIDGLLKNTKPDEIINRIKDILIYISSYVSEKKNNNWRIIFESLTKEDVLVNIFKINIKKVRNLFYSIRNYYSEISYYWLQLGLLEQRDKDYTKALNHLQMAESIRPEAYQIQHAIARNYLRHANLENNKILAEKLFLEGENLILNLINSQEYYKQKAKAFSIHCYINEKISYINKFNINLSNNELLKIKGYIDQILNDNEVMVKELINRYCVLLRKLDKVKLISFKPDSLYFKSLNISLNDAEEYNGDEDVLTDAI